MHWLDLTFNTEEEKDIVGHLQIYFSYDKKPSLGTRDGKNTPAQMNIMNTIKQLVRCKTRLIGFL